MDPGGPAAETAPLLPRPDKRSRPHGAPRAAPRGPPILLAAFATFFLTAALLLGNGKWRYSSAPRVDVAAVQQCSIGNARADLSFLDGARPIEAPELRGRRDRLAEDLARDGADALVVQDGLALRYFTNFSSSDWEQRRPHRSPLLVLAVSHAASKEQASIRAIFLTPNALEDRVRAWGVQSDIESAVVAYADHQDPYTTLIASHHFSERQNPKIVLDGGLDESASRNLTTAGFRVAPPIPEMQQARRVHSVAEIEILRAVNAGSVAAIRAARSCFVPGLTAGDVKSVLESTLSAIGFGLVATSVLFEGRPTASNDSSTHTPRLTYDTLVTINIQAHYLGYSSDVWRSVLIDPPRHHAHVFDGLCGAKQDAFDVIYKAQAAAGGVLRPGQSAASAYDALHAFIEEASDVKDLTYRACDGGEIPVPKTPIIGVAGQDIILEAGMTFGLDLGLCYQGKFGVRHRDVFLVAEGGQAELLAGRRAQSLREP